MDEQTGSDAGQLLSAVQRELRKVQTGSLDLSFNELLEMYISPDNELIIEPDYQRTFRWSAGKESKIHRVPLSSGCRYRQFS